MSYCIKIPNGILTMVETAFKCPNCEFEYDESFYEKRLDKSKNGVIYKSCKICKKKLGITTDIMGDIRVWLKETEVKFN